MRKEILTPESLKIGAAEIQLSFVGPLLRRKFTHAESLVTETRAEASHSQTACAMARAESLGGCTQLPGGHDTRAEDHDYGYGQQHIFRH